MSSYDRATWTCPECAERVESAAVVDGTFAARVEAHKAKHSVPLATTQRGDEAANG